MAQKTRSSSQAVYGFLLGLYAPKFLQDGDGKTTSLVLNPGPWEITVQRIN
jgi:hypothetical protein